jgi:2-oxoglutarate ferredoxin oxidoreductase subunit delta
MAKSLGELIIDIEKCKGCELCIEACPEEVLALSNKINKKGYQYVVTVNSNCTGCANCAIICPDAVFTVYRKIEKSA